MMTAYCVKYPHMPEGAVEKARSRVGQEWLEHYGMLYAACDGCLQCVQHYHVKGGSVIADVPATVWTGSFSDTRFNAWRGTFENQSAASLEGQEAVRDFLRSLDHAQEKITDTQKKWKTNSLLDHREALMVDAEGKTVACEWSQVAAQSKDWIEYPAAENWKTVSYHGKRQSSEDNYTESYRRNVDEFHDLCFHGQTQQARWMWRACPAILWETSQPAWNGRHLRASDYCRMGRHNGNHTSDLYQELRQAEEMDLMNEYPASASHNERVWY
jgi:hypothetical protein